MPSGFQNDSNQLQAEMYKVIITMNGGGGAYYPSASSTATDNGGVTPNSSDSFSTANLPTTLTSGQNRARGNMRFRNVVNRLSGLSDCQVRDITITEANGDAQATSLQFTVLYERPQFIALTGASIGTSTVGNNIANAAMDTTAKVIANAIAQGIRDVTTENVRVYDGTIGQDTEQAITVTTTGMTATQTLGTVAVTLIDESTLFD
jgi:hypothetical protein